MKLEFTKGGRGKTAPYKTTHVRIPEAIKPFVDSISQGYKEAIDNDKESEYLASLKLVNVNELKAITQEVFVLKMWKKSPKKPLDKLLTIIQNL